jgi:hypothetical protein
VSILRKEIIVFKLKECRGKSDITPRVSKKGESKSEIIGVSVTSMEKSALEELAAETERSVSYWAGKFMREGWENHKRATGGQSPQAKSGDHPETIKARNAHKIGADTKKNSKAS